jgi:hypothetical protein
VPRRRRRPPPPPRVAGPPWAQVEGHEVRPSRNEAKGYRCPWCQGWIEPGAPNLLVVPLHDPEDRRHYHAACWSKKIGKPRP